MSNKSVSLGTSFDFYIIEMEWSSELASQVNAPIVDVPAKPN